MQRIIHQLELLIPEVSIPLPSRITSVQVSLRSASFKSQFPMDGPLLFEEDRMTGSDEVKVAVFQDQEEAGWVGFLLSDQFPVALEGEFDMWFKLTSTAMSSPERVRSDLSPSKQARIRVSVKLREVASKRESSSPKRKLQLPDSSQACSRCDYLEKLVLSQHNELRTMEESYQAYAQVIHILERQAEEGKPVVSQEVDGMALELAKVFRNQSGPLSGQEADHMRMVLLGLNEKLKALQQYQHEVQQLRLQLKESHDSREDLEQSIFETTEQMKKQNEKNNEVHKQLIQERLEAAEALEKKHLEWKEKCGDEERLQREVLQLRGLLAKQIAENGNYVQMKAHIEALKAELEEAEHQRQALRQQYRKSMQDFELRSKDNQANISRLASEKLHLQAELDDVHSELLNQRADTDRVTQETLQLKARIAQLDGQLSIAGNQVQTINEVKSLADSFHSTAVEVESRMQESATSFQKRLDDISVLNSKLQSSEAKAKSLSDDFEQKLQSRILEIQELTREKIELTASIATLEQMLCVQEDLNQMSETANTQSDMNVAMKDQLIKELGAMSQSLIQQSERGLSANRLVTRMRELMEDKEFEIDILRRMVTELQRQRPVYIPVKVSLGRTTLSISLYQSTATPETSRLMCLS